MKSGALIFLLIICCSISIILSIIGFVVFSSETTPSEQTQIQQVPVQQTQEQAPDQQTQEQAPVQQPPLPKPSIGFPKGRYVQLRRIDGRDESINILEIEVYGKGGDKIKEDIIPSIFPQYDDVKYFGPDYLIDGLAPKTFTSTTWKLPHTTASKDAFMELDLGSEKEIISIVVKNRLDCCKDRIVGTEVQILDSNAGVIKSFQIDDVKDIYTFFTI